ncbi:Spx/MgsR family RNA polymerase-binding regulatory protein [Faucicola boevrei]|uniref:Spx/MgsR family RNA polymerase-binding regulatory protein n=1 Tax=Faucicola boevrei TaxID=346665 RepID=UPI00036B0B0A|nr:Spx/MgsR family RNA polymerase-binding regulatory protein [Moraxella boevrei]
MITIYGIKNCSTMKKAFEKLDNLGLAYTFFDYKKQTIDIATLQNWVNQAGIDKVLNKKGTTWRKLSENDKQQAENLDFALQLLQQNPSMIKRPIVVRDKALLVGFDESEFERLAD